MKVPIFNGHITKGPQKTCERKHSKTSSEKTSNTHQPSSKYFLLQDTFWTPEGGNNLWGMFTHFYSINI